jgi:hypothetical protein
LANLIDAKHDLIFRAIIRTTGGIQRPLLNLSAQNFANYFDQAVGYKLIPPFDPYANSINFLLASYTIPYLGLVGYVGTIPFLSGNTSRSVSTCHFLPQILTPLINLKIIILYFRNIAMWYSTIKEKLMNLIN